MVTLQTPKSLLVRAIVPWASDSAWKQVKEYSPTFVTEFIVMASQILMYKLAAHYLGKTGFSEYALARRTVSLLFPLPVLGMAVGLPRYIGFTNGRGDCHGASRYFGATLLCVAGAAFISVAVINIFSKSFAYTFFGNPGYSYLAFPLSVMIFGQCLHTVVCGYFRGHMMLNRANVLQTVNSAIVPILSFVLFGQSLFRALVAIGVTSTLAAAAALCFTPFKAVMKNNWKEIKDLLRYGVQRVPGDFILVALFTLPATLVAHTRGIEQAGFIAFGVSVVTIIGAVFAPVGLVLLPKAAIMIAEGSRHKLREHLRSMLKLTFLLCVVIVAAMWVWLPSLVHLYLGDGFEQVTPIARILILGALPYSVYLVLRNIVDAYHEYGVTAAILSCGLAVFLVGAYLGSRWHEMNGPLFAFLTSVSVVAGLSGLECRRILGVQGTSRGES